MSAEIDDALPIIGGVVNMPGIEPRVKQASGQQHSAAMLGEIREDHKEPLISLQRGPNERRTLLIDYVADGFASVDRQKPAVPYASESMGMLCGQVLARMLHPGAEVAGGRHRVFTWLLARISHRTCQPSEGKRQITSGIGGRRWPEGGKQSVNATKGRIPRSVGVFCLLGQAS
jgi:hypothetical protein